ncbi:MAG: bacteriocin family protein [Chloroflexi bacterium]|nr:bacteriocin family protein [Chloroflexota bacterium]
MTDYLMRESAPLASETWAKIDDMVVTVARKTLIARRFIDLVGPLGWGVEISPRFGFDYEQPYVAQQPEYVPLIELSQTFKLRGKHLAVADQTPFALDLGAAAIAAMELAKDENELVLGSLLKNPQCTSDIGDWTTPGGPFGAISTAIGKLRANHFDGPFALVMSPARYAQLAALMQQGQREIVMVESIADGGIFQWPDMADDKVLLIANAAWNLDIVVGQDIVTAYEGNDGLDHLFRVFETIALRVKRPGTVCVLQ